METPTLADIKAVTITDLRDQLNEKIAMGYGNAQFFVQLPDDEPPYLVSFDFSFMEDNGPDYEFNMVIIWPLPNFEGEGWDHTNNVNNTVRMENS